MDPRAFLASLTADGTVAPSLVHVRELPARSPVVSAFPGWIPSLVQDRMELVGVRGLYPHQADGLEVLAADRNLVMATGTASGKTLVYNLAFAAEAVERPTSTALYLFPTKALARDQLRAVRALTIPQMKAAVYDGDTPRAERPLIRKNANLVMTNPDMLHLALLSDHARWADFFFRLSLVVVDEAHVCRGVFGSHVAMTLRRLRRLVAHYGGSPRWMLASATIGNPGELATRLTGLAFDEVVADGAPSGEKLFALWNPPIIDEDSGARRSALTEASLLMSRLVQDDIRTIGFTRSRRAAELLAEFARRDVGDARKRARIKSYRAGYLAKDRRKLERELANGELLAIASTNALELGIDIGSLDAAVLTGYPGTRASMWQQAGRAGRRDTDSLAILVAQDDPLDQYLVHHPEDLFDKPPEAAVIDPTNPYVLEPHLRCAARELPLRDDELGFFGDVPDVTRAVERMVERGELVRRRDTWNDRGRESPHRSVDIRAGAGHVYSIVIGGTGELLGTADEHRAYATLHPGAVYLHQGDQYVVDELDLATRVAVVHEADPDYYTQSRDITDIEVIDADEHGRTGDVDAFFGTVRVTNQVVSYVMKLVSTNDIVDEIPLPLPPQHLETKAVWWTIPQAVVDRAAVSARELPGAVHAAEHAAIGLLPLVATCDRWDVGGVSTPLHPDTGLCTIFIYDGYPGGAGIVERGFRTADRWLAATLEAITQCPCSRGCPSCVQSPKCGNGNEPLDKQGAVALLAAILGEDRG
ncbi:MAG: DEAD/DEAH box helicase [Actinomycetota bacterium]